MGQLIAKKHGTQVAYQIIQSLQEKHNLTESGSKKFLDVKKQLGDLGVHIHKTGWDNEFRVVHKDEKHDEDAGYFTDDLDDAFHTGRKMTKKNGYGGGVRESWDEEDEMRREFQNPGSNSALRRATRSNPRNLPCPTCKEPNRLTLKDKRLGYQCNSCADRDEGGYGY